jgi:hypothetical protein
MDAAKVAEFSAHFETLTEWDLLDVDSRRATLTEEACIAFDQTLSKRGIDLGKLKEIEATEVAQQAKHEQEKQLRAEKRHARYFKFFLIIGLPIVIFGALFRTDRFYETFLSATVQAGVIGLLYWGYLKFKRSCNQRKP